MNTQPLGAKSYKISLRARNRELAEAINRYCTLTSESNADQRNENLDLIRTWAAELAENCSTEIRLNNLTRRAK